jgi:hypothetical protein
MIGAVEHRDGGGIQSSNCRQSVILTLVSLDALAASGSLHLGCWAAHCGAKLGAFYLAAPHS